MKKITLLSIILLSSPTYAYELYKDDKSQLDFYGQIRTFFTKLEHQDFSLEADSSRAGISGSREIFENGAKMFAKFEYNLSGNGGNLTNRQHILGFSHPDYGSISFGRMWTVSDDMPDADYSYAFGDKVKLYKALTYASHDSLIKYVYGNLHSRKDGDFFIAANVGLPEDDAKDSNGRKQSLQELFGGYVWGKLKFHGGYSQGRDKKRTYGASTNNDIESKYFNASVAYLLDDGKIGLTYNHRDLKKRDVPHTKVKTDSVSLAFEHKYQENWMKDGWFMGYGGYAYEKSSTDFDNMKDSNLTSVHAGVQYYFNKSTFVYAEYGYIDGKTMILGNVRGSTLGAQPTKYTKDNNVEVGFRFYW